MVVLAERVMMEHNPGFLRLVDEARTRICEIQVADVRERQQRGDGFVLIDVREESEWAEGRLPGAIHLGKGILERDIERVVPERDVEVILYCGGGYRSALAADALRLLGYTRPVSMDGGYKGWVAAGHPVTRDGP